MPGATSVGKTVTVKMQLAVLPLESRAVQVTVVFPTGKLKPEGGLQVMAGDGSQRLVVVTVKDRLFEHWPGGAYVMRLVGQNIEGGLVSVQTPWPRRGVSSNSKTNIQPPTRNIQRRAKLQDPRTRWHRPG